MGSKALDAFHALHEEHLIPRSKNPVDLAEVVAALNRAVQILGLRIDVILGFSSEPDRVGGCPVCGYPHPRGCEPDCPATLCAGLPDLIAGATVPVVERPMSDPEYLSAVLSDRGPVPTVGFPRVKDRSGLWWGPPSLGLGSLYLKKLLQEVTTAGLQHHALEPRVRAAAAQMGRWVESLADYLTALLPEWASVKPSERRGLEPLVVFASSHRWSQQQERGWVTALQCWHSTRWVYTLAVQCLWESQWQVRPNSLGIPEEVFVSLRIGLGMGGQTIGGSLAQTVLRVAGQRIFSGKLPQKQVGHPTLGVAPGQRIDPVRSATAKDLQKLPLYDGSPQRKPPGVMQLKAVIDSVILTRIIGLPPNADANLSEAGLARLGGREALRKLVWDMTAECPGELADPPEVGREGSLPVDRAPSEAGPPPLSRTARRRAAARLRRELKPETCPDGTAPSAVDPGEVLVGGPEEPPRHPGPISTDAPAAIEIATPPDNEEQVGSPTVESRAGPPFRVCPAKRSAAVGEKCPGHCRWFWRGVHLASKERPVLKWCPFEDCSLCHDSGHLPSEGWFAEYVVRSKPYRGRTRTELIRETLAQITNGAEDTSGG
jgi:hypothetical protein